MPPRHGKSELCTRRFPALALGLASDPELCEQFGYDVPPDLTFMSCSYNIDKAEEFGAEVRDIVRSSQYRELFPDVSLKEDTRAKGNWRTEQGGIYVSAGVGTALTGRGTPRPIVLIDDPLKDRQEADSETRRETVKQWYSSVVLSRFPRAIVIVQTRWHEDDLAGWQLEEQAKGGDKWRRLTLPAISDDGRALWPEMYPLDALERVRAATIPRDWSALYQQRPAPDDGAFFKRVWFNYYEDRPEHLRVYGVSDFAVTADGGDYTVHLVFGVDSIGRIYLLDMWRGQETALVWIEAQIDLMQRYKPLMWAGEAGVIEKAVGPFLQKRMRERKVFTRLEGLPSITDKAARARSTQGRAQQGMIYFPGNAAWTEDTINELLVFPAGKYDDRVDALGMVGRMLEDLVGASKPKAKTEVQKSGYERINRQDDNGWKTVG